MSGDAEQTYTLDEARVELRRRECMDFGHDWNILSVDLGQTPYRLSCDRCGKTYQVVPA